MSHTYEGNSLKYLLSSIHPLLVIAEECHGYACGEFVYNVLAQTVGYDYSPVHVNELKLQFETNEGIYTFLKKAKLGVYADCYFELCDKLGDPIIDVVCCIKNKNPLFECDTLLWVPSTNCFMTDTSYSATKILADVRKKQTYSITNNYTDSIFQSVICFFIKKGWHVFQNNESEFVLYEGNVITIKRTDKEWLQLGLTKDTLNDKILLTEFGHTESLQLLQSKKQELLALKNVLSTHTIYKEDLQLVDKALKVKMTESSLPSTGEYIAMITAEIEAAKRGNGEAVSKLINLYPKLSQQLGSNLFSLNDKTIILEALRLVYV